MSHPGKFPRSPRIPAPPGGHALRIDPRRAQDPVASRAPSAQLPIVDETSAGGLVIAVADDVYQAAIIARRNRAGRLEWCLPKGHLEGTETPEEAAIREIAEETGISGEVRRPLGVIDYWFTGEGRRVHKVVHHFLLERTGGHLTIENDPDGEAEEVAWVPVTDLGRTLTYANERRLAVAAQQVLAEHGPVIFKAPGR